MSHLNLIKRTQRAILDADELGFENTASALRLILEDLDAPVADALQTAEANGTSVMSRLTSKRNRDRTVPPTW